MFRFDKFVPGVHVCFLFFFFTIFSWCKVNLVSVKQGNFIYMPVLITVCVSVCAQESIPANKSIAMTILECPRHFMDIPRTLLRRYELAGMSIFFT